ncbi:sigma-70 family RNA polymerase sigma factor [Rhodopirellula sp.]|nr:sigma-70 family RNA polymerase sigma factor [Rhodopirellula sp.]
MSLSDFDRKLLQCCLDRAPRAWQNFVDRFLGLVIHVANHVAESRGVKLDQASRDDLVAEVFLVLVADDFSVLRKFRRNCSLATYLTVISRRVIIRRLNAGNKNMASTSSLESSVIDDVSPKRIENAEEVHKLLSQLDEREAAIVRMYHLDGKSYDEISRLTGLAVNSIGPVLTRARAKMRGNGEGS